MSTPCIMALLAVSVFHLLMVLALILSGFFLIKNQKEREAKRWSDLIRVAVNSASSIEENTVEMRRMEDRMKKV
jgi:hypothetical protein